MGVFREAGLVFFGRVVGVGLVFFSTQLVTNSLGESKAGIFFYVQAFILILSIISRLGFDNVIVRKLAVFQIPEDRARVWAIVLKVLLPVMLLSIFLGVAFYSFSPSLEKHVAMDGLGGVLQVLVFSLPALAILFILSEAMKGLSETALATFMQSVLLPLLFSLILAVQIAQGGADELTVSKGYMMAAVISLAVSMFFFLGKAGYPIINLSHGARLGELLRESIPLLFAGASGIMFSWTDTLVLGAVGSSSDVGLYVVASRISQVIALILMVANTVLGVRFSRLYQQGEIADLKKLFIVSSGLMLLAGVLLGFAEWKMSAYLLGLFGKGFVAGDDVLRILILGQIVNVATGASGMLLVMMGGEKVLRNIMIFVATFNLLLSIVLGGEYGGVGVALATAVSLLIMNSLFVYKLVDTFRICQIR